MPRWPRSSGGSASADGHSARSLARLRRLIRANKALHPTTAAAPFLRADAITLRSFQRLVDLRESSPDHLDQLATLIAAGDPRGGERLNHVAEAIPDHVFHSVREAIARRGYRRVHSAALGAGAVILWSFPGDATEQHWRHGNAAALLALLACAEDRVLRDRAFAAGLLHDLGRFSCEQASTTPAPNGSDLLSAVAPEGLDEGEYAYVAEQVGRATAQGLSLPAWLPSALVPCCLRAPYGDELASAVSAACVVANEVGIGTASTTLDEAAPDPAHLERIRHELDAVGGRSWLEERMRGPLVAAEEGIGAILSVA
jgi:hypothetical protein